MLMLIWEVQNHPCLCCVVDWFDRCPVCTGQRVFPLLPALHTLLLTRYNQYTVGRVCVCVCGCVCGREREDVNDVYVQETKSGLCVFEGGRGWERDSKR